MRGLIIALLFFGLGVLAGPHMGEAAESRLAVSDAAVPSVSRVPFENYKVYPDQLVVSYPGLRYATVASNSMAPVITDKSVVFEKKPLSPAEISINDVISFYEPSVNGTVLHLVHEIIYENGKPYYRTKGAANPAVDPWLVSFENVKGIMVGTFR